ncbi:hypothetical protein FQZ97_1266270 [compost metagenome]
MLAHGVVDAIIAQGQHAVEGAIGKTATIALDAKAVAGRIGELAIFFGCMEKAVGGFLAAGQGGDDALVALEYHARHQLHARGWFGRRGFLDGLPERVGRRQGERQEGLEGPVGTLG